MQHPRSKQLVKLRSLLLVVIDFLTFYVDVPTKNMALRAVARAVGKETVAVPAHPEFLRKLLDQAAPASLGMGRAAWNNARSLTGKALEWACLASMPGHYQAPFTPAWDHLWTKLPVGTALSFQLSRLFHWASAQCVAPADVNDPVLAL
jgi:hypothetical protein